MAVLNAPVYKERCNNLTKLVCCSFVVKAVDSYLGDADVIPTEFCMSR